MRFPQIGIDATFAKDHALPSNYLDDDVICCISLREVE